MQTCSQPVRHDEPGSGRMRKIVPAGIGQVSLQDEPKASGTGWSVLHDEGAGRMTEVV